MSAPASTRRRVLAQTSFEARAILRNGEQLLVTIIVPVLVLVGLTKVTGVDLDTGGASRIDFLTPGILALAVMTTSFTSQAIASSFDRRNGVLRLLSTTPLGRGGLLAGKVLGVLVVEIVQVVVIGLTALLLGVTQDGARLERGLGEDARRGGCRGAHRRFRPVRSRKTSSRVRRPTVSRVASAPCAASQAVSAATASGSTAPVTV